MKSRFTIAGVLASGLFAAVFASAVAAQELKATWVKKDADWQRYDAFLVKPLVVDDVKVIKPAWAQDDPSDWTVDIEDLAGMQAIFRDTMRDVLGADGGYPLVYGDGGNVLEVEVEILSITPWLKPGADSSAGDHEVETLGSGEIAGRVELRDSTTRELLLLIEGEKAVGEQYQRFTRENNITNVKSMFTKFAQRLRGLMDAAHGK